MLRRHLPQQQQAFHRQHLHHLQLKKNRLPQSTNR
jgi:hypothetical protein